MLSFRPLLLVLLLLVAGCMSNAADKRVPDACGAVQCHDTLDPAKGGQGRGGGAMGAGMGHGMS